MILHNLEPIPKSAPTIDKLTKTKSKKVIKLNDYHFFVSESKLLGLKVFSIELGCLIFASPFLTRNEAIEYINAKIIPIFKQDFNKILNQITIRIRE
jgi:hypothetical protein